VNNAESLGRHPLSLIPCPGLADGAASLGSSYSSNLAHDGYPFITSVLLWRRYSHR